MAVRCKHLSCLRKASADKLNGSFGSFAYGILIEESAILWLVMEIICKWREQLFYIDKVLASEEWLKNAVAKFKLTWFSVVEQCGIGPMILEVADF